MRIVLFISLFISSYSLAQDTLNYHWVEKGSLKVDSTSIWTVDNLGNQYIVQDKSIRKIDSAGTLKFSQSIKSLGNSRQIVAINSMKLVHFSAEQQTLCFFDNTLTQSEDCMDLYELGIINASLICSSSRPNRLWIFDDLNSTLNLVSIDKGETTQELINLSGILEIDSCIQILEKNNKLYLLDAKRGIYIFDLFGSLLDFIQQPGITCFDVHEKALFYIVDKKLKARLLDSEDVIDLDLPITDVMAFSIRRNLFHFRTSTDVHKFYLQF